MKGGRRGTFSFPGVYQEDGRVKFHDECGRRMPRSTFASPVDGATLFDPAGANWYGRQVIANGMPRSDVWVTIQGLLREKRIRRRACAGRCATLGMAGINNRGAGFQP